MPTNICFLCRVPTRAWQLPVCPLRMRQTGTLMFHHRAAAATSWQRCDAVAVRTISHYSGQKKLEHSSDALFDTTPGSCKHILCCSMVFPRRQSAPDASSTS